MPPRAMEPAPLPQFTTRLNLSVLGVVPRFGEFENVIRPGPSLL